MDIAGLALAGNRAMTAVVPYYGRGAAEIEAAIKKKKAPKAVVGEAPADFKTALVAFLKSLSLDGLSVWAKAGVALLIRMVPTMSDLIWDWITKEAATPTPAVVFGSSAALMTFDMSEKESGDLYDLYAECVEKAK